MTTASVSTGLDRKDMVKDVKDTERTELLLIILLFNIYIEMFNKENILVCYFFITLNTVMSGGTFLIQEITDWGWCGLGSGETPPTQLVDGLFPSVKHGQQAVHPQRGGNSKLLGKI